MSDVMNLDPIVHDDLEPIKVSVMFRGDKYVLTEATESAAVQFNSARVSAARFQDGELNRVEKAAEVEPLFLSLCLFKVNTDGSTVNVGINMIKSWPARFVKKIFDKAIEISGLDEKKTVVQIDKEITKLQKKRIELLKGDSPPKDVPADTPTTSD